MYTEQPKKAVFFLPENRPISLFYIVTADLPTQLTEKRYRDKGARTVPLQIVVFDLIRVAIYQSNTADPLLARVEINAYAPLQAGFCCVL